MIVVGDVSKWIASQLGSPNQEEVYKVFMAIGKLISQNILDERLITSKLIVPGFGTFSMSSHQKLDLVLADEIQQELKLPLHS